MIDIEIQAAIAKVSLFVKEDDGVIVRKSQMKLDREFDDEIAAGIGGDARKVLTSLRGHGISKVVIPIDAIDAQAVIVGSLTGESIKIPSLRGIKATGTAPKDADDVARISLEMECQYDREIWKFLGDNCGGYCRLTLKQRQLSLGAA
jgi:hypothetical protein